MKKPKIVLFDLENAPIITATFSLYPKAIHHSMILRDTFIICGAWKELGSSKTEAIGITKEGDDYKVVKKIRDVLADADAIVAHNGKKFDIKLLNARLVYHNLQPLPLIPVIDTLLEVKKVCRFTSNRLDYLGQFLTADGKIDTSPGLWLKAMKGNKAAITEMIKYNKKDVIVLENVYKKIRPYMATHPHVGGMSNKPHSCNKCGSTDLRKNGTRYTATGMKRQEYQCKKCNSYVKYPIK